MVVIEPDGLQDVVSTVEGSEIFPLDIGKRRGMREIFGK